jgi:hypothetical protein
MMEDNLGILEHDLEIIKDYLQIMGDQKCHNISKLEPFGRVQFKSQLMEDDQEILEDDLEILEDDQKVRLKICLGQLCTDPVLVINSYSSRQFLWSKKSCTTPVL